MNIQSIILVGLLTVAFVMAAAANPLDVVEIVVVALIRNDMMYLI